MNVPLVPKLSGRLELVNFEKASTPLFHYHLLALLFILKIVVTRTNYVSQHSAELSVGSAEQDFRESFGPRLNIDIKQEASSLPFYSQYGCSMMKGTVLFKT